ncbi:MFS transporter [Spirosoma linguale]|uniref:Major facilitator superfamily MFS_1 n=1 Tax=Spirosoma linguale (strain ATCC 33905 / DSM 74 / LMG 10896 / Claus 1) TaxID=504472 RepID=D2QDX9_SPILD|nr:major facilitator superfamily MFS_1 [Spirosoma linguale DSM 74]
MSKNRQLLLIFSIVLIDVIAGSGLGVLISNYVLNLPAKPVLMTVGTALMLGVQLAGSPAIGRWSDLRGRRPAAIATTVVSLLSSLFLLPVQTWGYVASRWVKGGSNGLYSVMRSAVADLTDKDELLKYGGLFSFIAGSAPVIGPMGAGWLMLVVHEARINPLPTVLLLLALGLLNIRLAMLFRETNPKKEAVDYTELADKARNSLKVVSIWRQLLEADKQLPGIKSILILNLLATLGMGYFAFFVAFLTQSELIMTPAETARFFLYYGGLALAANFIFFTYIVQHVNKRIAILVMALISIVLQVVYTFSESSVELFYVVAGVDALTVSIITGLTGGILSQVIKEGSGQGEMFGNIQALGGLASFATALVNSLLSGVSLKAPFIFCAISMIAVVIWTIRLPKAARQHTDSKTPAT